MIDKYKVAIQGWDPIEIYAGSEESALSRAVKIMCGIDLSWKDVWQLFRYREGGRSVYSFWSGGASVECVPLKLAEDEWLVTEPGGNTDKITAPNLETALEKYCEKWNRKIEPGTIWVIRTKYVIMTRTEIEVPRYAEAEFKEFIAGRFWKQL